MAGDSIIAISASGLDFQHKRLETIASNIANANVTRSQSGQVYRPLEVVGFSDVDGGDGLSASGLSLQTDALQGVGEFEVVERNTPARKVYDPTHPDADAQGYVEYPGVDQVVEMTNMLTATRAYEANIKAIQAAKSMAMKALEIGE